MASSLSLRSGTDRFRVQARLRTRRRDSSERRSPGVPAARCFGLFRPPGRAGSANQLCDQSRAELRPSSAVDHRRDTVLPVRTVARQSPAETASESRIPASLLLVQVKSQRESVPVRERANIFKTARCTEWHSVLVFPHKAIESRHDRELPQTSDFRAASNLNCGVVDFTIRSSRKRSRSHSAEPAGGKRFRCT